MKLVLAKSCDLIESVLPFGLEVKLNAYLSLMGNGKMLLSVIVFLNLKIIIIIKVNVF